MTVTIQEAARHYAAGEFPEAARACVEIIRSDPGHYDALHLLGVLCTNQGQHADGVSYLLRAAAVGPNDGRLLANLGSAYGAQQRFDKAIEAYRAALALQRPTAGVLNNLGLALSGRGLAEEAIKTFRDGLRLDPSYDPVLYNLARTSAGAGYLTEAEADFRLLLSRLRPDAPADRAQEATNELARVLTEQGRPELALEMISAAVARHPGVVSFRWHESLLLLLLGRFAEGWLAYERRWEAPGHDLAHPDHRILDLDQVGGQRVLVREEQGRGDVIHFLRYIRPLAARGARIRLSVYADLVTLANEMPDVELVLGPDEDEAEYDQLTSLLSLPLAFGTSVETIPAEVPYLRAPASRIARMKHHLGPPSGSRIGLVWSGSASSRARSSMPAATLEPLLRWPNVEFHCLQKEIVPEDQDWLDRTGIIRTHQAVLGDFADTAALIEQMNLVISIDTAVAHLAGALAKPVWVMLPFNPDWRWLLGRDDSPWYPTARLFRQAKPRDWESVVRSVAEALRF